MLTISILEISENATCLSHCLVVSKRVPSFIHHSSAGFKVQQIDAAAVQISVNFKYIFKILASQINNN